MSCIQFFTAFVLNLILAFIFESPISFTLIGDKILPLLYLGICSSGIAYTLQIVGQRDVPPATASIILSLESVFGIIGTALFLGQTLTPREYLGCAVVLAAVILSQIDYKPRRAKDRTTVA
jgi:drug/metabolite transporter (DMT)-like permease